MQFWSENLV